MAHGHPIFLGLSVTYSQCSFCCFAGLWWPGAEACPFPGTGRACNKCSLACWLGEWPVQWLHHQCGLVAGQHPAQPLRPSALPGHRGWCRFQCCRQLHPSSELGRGSSTLGPGLAACTSIPSRLFQQHSPPLTTICFYEFDFFYST